MSIGIHYKNEAHIFDEIEASIGDNEKDTVPYLSYPLFSNTGIVNHGFSTRLGGVSEDYFSSMNLSFSRGDDADKVMENFHRFAKAIGVQASDMVFSHQTHTTNVRVVTEKDRGNGITRPQKLQDVDGLITNIPGICLVTFYADCVPLLFVDPVERVIGASHSGWRGTVGKIGKETVAKLTTEFNCKPENILAAVGPSVCQDCYEVSEDVIEQFQKNYEKKHWDDLFYKKENGHYQLNLWKANEIVFAEAGIRPEHMAITNVCTHCNSNILYSHRAMGNERGSLAAFLSLKEDI